MSCGVGPVHIVYRGFAVVLVLFIFFITFQSIEVHTYGRTIIDDGYYYLGYARNIAAGNGPTFDGLIQTNGVQPLWAGMLSVVALIVPDKINLIYAMLILSNVFSVLSAWMLYLALKQFLSVPYALFGGGLLLLTMANPMLAQQGMELNVNMFLLLLAWFMALRLKSFAVWPILRVGFVVGLVCLGRIDNLILTPIFALTAAYRITTAQISRPPLYRLVVSIALLALPALMMFGAYLLINLNFFGRPLPVSGDVKAIWIAQELDAPSRFSIEHLSSTTQNAALHLGFVINYAFSLVLAYFGPQTVYARVFLLIGIVILFVYVILRRVPTANKISRPKLSLWAVVLIGVANVWLHTWLMYFQLDVYHGTQPWYYAAEYVTVCIAVTLVVRWLVKLTRNTKLIHGISLYLIVMSLFGMGVYYAELMRPPETMNLNTLYRATQWLNDNVPDDSVVGSWNSGLVGYFSESTVINLDGLMNNQDIITILEGQDTYWDYAQRHSIDYVMDYISPQWSMGESDFRGIPTQNLTVLYEYPFTDWMFIPMVYYIFRIEG